MNIRIAVLFTLILGFLPGCATIQSPLSLTPNALNTPSCKVGVMMTDLPKVGTWFPGANCLLCLAVASAANSKLTDYTRTLPYENLPKLKNQVVEVLRQKGATATVIEDKIDFNKLPNYKSKGSNVAQKDYTSLKSKLNVNKLVVISLSGIGISRPYASYIPTGEPMAEVSGLAYLINLDNNTYEWYLPIDVSKRSDGKWDEPPSFPGLTNAYFQALELTADTITKPLST